MKLVYKKSVNLASAIRLQVKAQNSKDKRTAALPTSFARLEKACHSGPIRSMADSTPVLSSSTIKTKNTLPVKTIISL